MPKLTQTLTSPHRWTDPGPAANKRRKWLRAEEGEEGEEGMFLETNTQDEMKTIVRELRASVFIRNFLERVAAAASELSLVFSQHWKCSCSAHFRPN